MSAMPLAFVDTETTGLSADYHEIWEVALIVEGDERVWQLPIDLKRADPKALEIGHFYDRYNPQMLTSVAEFARDFLSYFEEIQTHVRDNMFHVAKRHLVGAVPNFDDERLRKLLAPHRHPQDTRGWHYHLIDVEALAVGFLGGKAWCAGTGPAAIELPWKSDDLSRACGVEPPNEAERHTALGDARWAKRLYEAICGPA